MSIASISSDNRSVSGTWENDFVCSHEVNSEHTPSSSELSILKTRDLEKKFFFIRIKEDSISMFVTSWMTLS